MGLVAAGPGLGKWRDRWLWHVRPRLHCVLDPGLPLDGDCSNVLFPKQNTQQFPSSLLFLDYLEVVGTLFKRCLEIDTLGGRGGGGGSGERDREGGREREKECVCERVRARGRGLPPGHGAPRK